MSNTELRILETAEQSKESDRYTIASEKLSAIDLMEAAGAALGKRIIHLYEEQTDPLTQNPILILCGPGNNGGDGWMLAHLLWKRNIPTCVLFIHSTESASAEAILAKKQFTDDAEKQGWTLLSRPALHELDEESFLTTLRDIEPSIVVDAMYGTGLSRPLTGIAAYAVSELNSYRQQHPTSFVVAVDVPSGISSDGNVIDGPNVLADVTVTFGNFKIAHLSEPTRFSCGKLYCEDIGLKTPPDSLKTHRVFGILQDQQPLISRLFTPSPAAHKNHYGHVGILEGALETRGASRLAARGALRSGTGLVSLIVENASNIMPGDQPELMKRTMAYHDDADIIGRFTSLVLGPGLSNDPQKQEQARRLLSAAICQNIPCVLDAEALPLLGTNMTKTNRISIVATPHPGEAARLLGVTASEIQQDRVAAVKKLCELPANDHVDLVWILKGACPIVAKKNGNIVVCEGGISALAVGGSGDVLAGCVAALLKQSVDPFDAALLAATAHLAAGRRLAAISKRGYLASELADAIATVLFGN